MNLEKCTTKKSDIERVAYFLGLSHTKDNLCLNIQSKIQDLKNENKKLKFVNKMITNENNKIHLQLKTLKAKECDFQYIDRVKNKFDDLYKILKTENKELNNTIIGLKQEIEYYKNQIKENKLH